MFCGTFVTYQVIAWKIGFDSAFLFYIKYSKHSVVQKPIYISESQKSPYVLGHRQPLFPKYISLPLLPMSSIMQHASGMQFKEYCSEAGFLNLGTPDVLGPVILCWCSGCPVHHGIFSSIHAFYPLDASSLFRVAQNKNICKHCQSSLGAKLPLVEHYYSRGSVGSVERLPWWALMQIFCFSGFASFLPMRHPQLRLFTVCHSALILS